MYISTKHAKSNAYIDEINKVNKKTHSSLQRKLAALPSIKLPFTKILPTTKEKEEMKTRRKNILKKLRVAVIGMLLIAVVCMPIFAYKEYKSYVPGFDVSIDGEHMGRVHSKEEFYDCFEDVKRKISQAYKNEVSVAQHPEFEKIREKEDTFTLKKEIERQIVSVIDVTVAAYVITVDGEKLAVVKHKEDANTVLEKLKQPFIPENPDVKVAFNKNVDVKKAFVKIGEIQNIDLAFNNLSKTEDEVKVYEVKKGDTLWDIAFNHKMEVADIEKLNPKINEILTIGQKINLTEPKPILGVETREKIVYNEDIPYDVEKINDPTLYEGRSTIIKKGICGEKQVEAEIVKVNGIEKGKQILKELVLNEPKIQEVKVGTKPLPPKHGTGVFGNPVFGTLTSRFGMRWGRMHNGIDIGASTGTQIYAADGGKVIFAGWKGGYGYLVEIYHDNEYTTRYAHCSKVLVSAGQRVAKGEVVAKVGNTGRSTGPHLHFEVRKNNVPQNPLGYVRY